MKVEDVYNTLKKCLQKMNKILLALYLRRGHAGSATLSIFRSNVLPEAKLASLSGIAA